MSAISIKGFIGITNDALDLAIIATGKRYNALVFLGGAVKVDIKSTPSTATPAKIWLVKIFKCMRNIKIISTAVKENVVVLDRLLGLDFISHFVFLNFLKRRLSVPSEQRLGVEEGDRFVNSLEQRCKRTNPCLQLPSGVLREWHWDSGQHGGAHEQTCLRLPSAGLRE
jgi:hypothetical protein